MHFQCSIPTLMFFRIYQWAAMNYSCFFFFLFHFLVFLLSFSYYINKNGPIKNNFLIMIKRFALNLFRTNKRSLYLFSQSQKLNQRQQFIQKQAFKSNQRLGDEQDKQQQYVRPSRNTTGWMIYRILFWGSSAILAYNVYLVSKHQKKSPVQDEPGSLPGFITLAKQIYKNYNYATQFLTKPPVSKLLPDPVHPQFQQKTLVLNLSGTLVNSQYVLGKGLIVHKRPGLNQFLKKMSQIYEVIIFSNEDPMFLSSIIPSLDPKSQMITNYFGNQCMVLSRGKYIKDLKYLNRDLKRIIVIDKNKESTLKHKQNVILLPQYKGEQNDRQLIQLTSLLQNLANPQIKDIRKNLQQMGQDPVKAYSLMIKQKQQKVKNTKNNKIFGFFDKKN